MAWIESFTVWGLAGRKDPVSYSFNRDVNVLWGTNGCGKTSLLKILHSALRNDASSILKVPFTRATVKFYSVAHEITYTRTISRKSTDKSKTPEIMYLRDEDDGTIRQVLTGEAAPEWRTTPTPHPRSKGPFAHGYLPISRVNSDPSAARRYHSGASATSALLNESDFDNIYAQNIQDLWWRYSTNLLSKTTEIQQRGLAELARTVIERKKATTDIATAVDAGEAYEAVQNFFSTQKLKAPKVKVSEFSRHYEEDTGFRNIVNDMVAVQDEVDRARRPARRVEMLLGRLFYGNKHVHLGSREISVITPSAEIPISALASGEKQILRLLLECLAAEENSIIIDEPEISLHVDWQHNLIDHLQYVNPSAQIIAATHSPEIMANLDDSRIFEL